MGNIIVDLLPLIVGATLVPLYPIVVLLFLQQGEDGLVKPLSFVVGGTAEAEFQGQKIKALHLG